MYFTDEPEYVVLNGTKRWCTGADFADAIYCLVRSGDNDARHENLSFVLVPTDAPGISILPIEHANLRYTLSSDVILEDVEVPTTREVSPPDG